MREPSTIFRAYDCACGSELFRPEQLVSPSVHRLDPHKIEMQVIKGLTCIGCGKFHLLTVAGLMAPDDNESGIEA